MSLPQIGKPLPDFSLPAVQKSADGFTATTISNASLAGRAFVLFIYPKDATSGCTIEACHFGELYAEFQKLGVEVIGLSRDKLSAHKRFITNQSLPYPLASDEGAPLLKSWDLLVNKTMYGKPVTGVARTTFLVDKQGIVRQVWENVTPAGHATEVLKLAATL
jgi:peroxiredoxin Q/BCP